MTAIHDAESVDAGVRRLHHAYADVVMRRAWDDLDGLFAPGAPITLDLVTSPVQRFEGVTVASDGAWELSVPADQAHAALAYLGKEREPAFALFIDLFGIDYGEVRSSRSSTRRRGP